MTGSVTARYNSYYHRGGNSLPLYEYKCTKCGRRFEELRRFSDPPLTVCEKCGGTLEQLISPPAIQFKGSGWYVTDYAKKSSDRSASSDTASTTEKKAAGPESASGPAKASAPAKTSEPAKTNKE